jgi:hypothetical protein
MYIFRDICSCMQRISLFLIIVLNLLYSLGCKNESRKVRNESSTIEYPECVIIKLAFIIMVRIYFPQRGYTYVHLLLLDPFKNLLIGGYGPNR